MGARSEFIALTYVRLDGAADANALFIVKAVNAHDRLVAALRAFLQYEDGRELQQAETNARQLLNEIEG